eukprot:2374962-Prymnesium_polylepis.2
MASNVPFAAVNRLEAPSPSSVAPSPCTVKLRPAGTVIDTPPILMFVPGGKSIWISAVAPSSQMSLVRAFIICAFDDMTSVPGACGGSGGESGTGGGDGGPRGYGGSSSGDAGEAGTGEAGGSGGEGGKAEACSCRSLMRTGLVARRLKAPPISPAPSAPDCSCFLCATWGCAWTNPSSVRTRSLVVPAADTLCAAALIVSIKP